MNFVVCCSVLQCVAVCCSVLQCVAIHLTCSVHQYYSVEENWNTLLLCLLGGTINVCVDFFIWFVDGYFSDEDDWKALLSRWLKDIAETPCWLKHIAERHCSPPDAITDVCNFFFCRFSFFNSLLSGGIRLTWLTLYTPRINHSIHP